METDKKNLHELVQASIDSIEEHIKSVEKLPIEEEYKKELTSVLSKLYESISAAKPILSHLDQVRGLVINPIQEGVEKAFNESNKWGVLGLKVSIASLLITVAFGLFGSKIPRIGRFFDANTRGFIKIIEDDSTCSSPKISRILKPLESDQKNILYISGECFKTSNVQFSGINIPAQKISDSLLSIDVTNALKTEKGNVVSVLNYYTNFKDGSDVTMTPIRFDKETMTVYGGKLLTKERLSDYRTSYEISFSTSEVRILWKFDSLVHIGSIPKYFGNNLKPIDAYSIKFHIDQKVEESDLYLLVTASGIGPAGGEGDEIKYSAMTSLRINSLAYELDKFWPYWGDSSANYRSATFAVPIQRKNILNGENTLELIAGRYTDREGNIKFDNSLFKSIKLVVKLDKDNLIMP